MTPTHAYVLFLAATLAGALNSVAGGGSFISFPALLIYGNIPPPMAAIRANATNTVALWPGSVASAAAYRRELEAQRHVLLLLGCASLAGGWLGARLLLHTPETAFVALLPYLMLVATLLFTFGGTLTKRIRARIGKLSAPGWMGIGGVVSLQFCIAVYGGYFGGGIGILMLATLALMGMEEIHMMNALKTVLAALINGVAVVLFISAGAVVWPQALLMVVGGIVGGYGGAFYARKLPPALVRQFVIVVGFSMTLYFFLHR